MTIEATLASIEGKLDALLAASTKDAAPVAAPAPRGRGRPVKGEAPVTAAPATSAEPEADPFAAKAPEAPAVTLEQVRKALTGLKDATDQVTALAVLKKAGGADNLSSLTADKYGAVVNAAALAMPIHGTPLSKPVDDPFETVAAAPAATPEPTLEDVKKAVVGAQGRAGTNAVQKIVADNGGVAGNPPGVSLKALPVSKYATVIAACNALGSTK